MTKFNKEQLETRSLLAAVGTADEGDSWLSWAAKETVKVGVSFLAATAAARSTVKAINFDSLVPETTNPMENSDLMTPVVGDEEFQARCPWEPVGNGSRLDMMDMAELTEPVLGDKDGTLRKVNSFYNNFSSSFYEGPDADLMEPMLEGAPIKAAIAATNWQQALDVAEAVTGAARVQSVVGSWFSSATSAVTGFIQEQYEDLKDQVLSEKDTGVSVKEFATEVVETTADLTEGLSETEEADADSENTSWLNSATIGVAGHLVVNKALPALGALDSNMSKNLLNGAAQHAAGAYTFGDTFLSVYEKLDELEAEIKEKGVWASVKNWASTPLQTVNAVADATGMNAGGLIVAGAAAVTIGAPVFAAGSGVLATIGVAAANMYVVSQTFGDVSEKIDEDFKEFAKTGDEYIASGIEMAFDLADKANNALVSAKSYVQNALGQFKGSAVVFTGAGLLMGNLVKMV